MKPHEALLHRRKESRDRDILISSGEPPSIYDLDSLKHLGSNLKAAKSRCFVSKNQLFELFFKEDPL
jgi:hypothetical protein